MSKIVNRIAAIAALALAATPIVGLAAAHAAEAPAPIARIRVGDLTLSNPADAREFARRTHAAGTRACDAKGFTGMSAKACMIDFHQDVQHALTKQQAAQLRVGKRAGA